MASLSRTLKCLLTVAGLVAGWEITASLWEKRRYVQGRAYWQTYYDPETVQRRISLRRVAQLPSTGVSLHVDLYPARNQMRRC